MPTADSFDQAALIFAGAADDSRRLARPIRAKTGPNVLSGSRLAESVDELLDDSERQLRQIAKELQDLKDEARRRAQVTRDAAAAAASFTAEQQAFDLALAEFEANGSQGAPPLAPEPPDPAPYFADF